MTTLCITETRKIAIIRNLLRWWRKSGRQFEWRDRKLSSYETAILELMLRRTTATAAARIFPIFVAKFNDLNSLRTASSGEIKESLMGIGLENQRASDLKKMADAVLLRRSRAFPIETLDLESVPGIGPYSARAIQVYSRGRPVCPIDSNVSRILNRVFGNLQSRDRDEIQEFADSLVARTQPKNFNWGLLDLGAIVCRYDRPRCEICPLRLHCDFAAENNLYRPRS